MMNPSSALWVGVRLSALFSGTISMGVFRTSASCSPAGFSAGLFSADGWILFAGALAAGISAFAALSGACAGAGVTGAAAGFAMAISSAGFGCGFFSSAISFLAAITGLALISGAAFTGPTNLASLVGAFASGVALAVGTGATGRVMTGSDLAIGCSTG